MSRIQIASLSNGVLFATEPFASPSNPAGVPVLTPAVGSSCLVYLHGTQTAATVYADETSATVLPQPLITDVAGTVPGWVDSLTLPLDLSVSLSTGGVKTYVLVGGGSGVQQYNAVGVGAPPKTSGLFVTGDADITLGALSFIKATGVDGHALTVFYSPTTGATQAALNVVSNNPQFSSMELTGVETAHGTLKIAHVGHADGSDANAAAVSIDLQTSVGTGTAAQGIFITSTTDSPSATLGHVFNARLNGLDWFKVEGANIAGSGVVGIGVPISHVPIGMLEIAQKDTTTPGLFMKAIASGADLVQLQDSGGVLRFQVSNVGATVIRGSAFFSGNAIIGSTSNDNGGAGSALTVCHTTDPTTNPAAGHVIVYTDALGNLMARTSAGNVRTIAAV